MSSNTDTDPYHNKGLDSARSTPLDETVSMTANELAVLANGLIDELESAKQQRTRVRRWLSPDGATEVVRRSRRFSQLQMLEYSRSACYSHIVIRHEGRHCFSHRDLVWPGVSADMEQLNRFQVPRSCVANLLAFHRQQGNWIHDVFTAKSAKRVPVQKRPAYLDGLPRHKPQNLAVFRQRAYPTRPSAIEQLFQP